MSGIAIDSETKSAPITIDRDLAVYIAGLVNTQVEKAIRENKVGDRMITRAMIVRETSRKLYDKGVREGFLNPISINGRNAQHFVFRSEYDAYLRHLQINRNIH